SAGGRVFATAGIAIERITTVGRVGFAALCVAKERTSTGGRVAVGGGIAIECLVTDSGVAAAGCEAEERFFTLSRVLVGITSVRRRINRSSRGQEHKPAKHERDRAKQKTAPPKRAHD